jgi:peptide deformylase
MTQNLKLGEDQILQGYKLEGQMLKIFTYPEPILKKIAEPVTVFDDHFRALCFDMLYTMYHAPGIGLAAPQVGVSQRFFVMDIGYEREKVINADGKEFFELSDFQPRIIVNPHFSHREGEILYEEGCLSVPGVYEEVKRSEKIHLKYQDMWGNHHQLDAEDLFSICLQHENDHLDGIVFLERLTSFKRKFLTEKYLKNRQKKPKDSAK